MFYIRVIVVAVFIIASLHLTLFSSFWHALFCTAFATVAVIVIDGVTAFLIRRLPERYFAPDSDFFHVGEKERRLYRKWKIKVWKDKVPELGCFTGFHKNKLENVHDREYLARFLVESNYGVIIHIVNALAGFLLILLPELPITVSLSVAMVNFVLSMMPVAVLRYNTAPLRRLYIKSLARNA